MDGRMPTGTAVTVQFTKWGGRRHHGGQVVYLGADEHGDWLGDRAGSQWSGGPTAFTTVTDNIMLVPRDRAFVVTSYLPHPELTFALYVDICTVPVWDGATVTAVDLDLDVIAEFDGTVFVDDEDEFEEHQAQLGYPPQVIAAAEADCAWVLERVQAGTPPFALASALPWREVLASHTFPA